MLELMSVSSEDVNEFWTSPALTLLSLAKEKILSKAPVLLNNLDPNDRIDDNPYVKLDRLRTRQREFLHKYIRDRQLYIRAEGNRITSLLMYGSYVCDEDQDYLEDTILSLTEYHTALTSLPAAGDHSENCVQLTQLVFNRVRVFKMLMGGEVDVSVCCHIRNRFSGQLMSLAEHLVRSPGAEHTLKFVLGNIHNIQNAQYKSMMDTFVKGSLAYRNALLNPALHGIHAPVGQKPVAHISLWDLEAPVAAGQLFTKMIRQFDKVSSHQGMSLYDILIALLEYQALTPAALYV